MFFILTISEKEERDSSKLVVLFAIITGDFNFVSSVVTPTGGVFQQHHPHLLSKANPLHRPHFQHAHSNGSYGLLE